MGIVPEFEFDVFVSYAHLDDLKLAEDDRGWVTDFYNAVHDRLWQEMRKKPSMWRDLRDLDGRLADASIAGALHKSAVFLAIVSPAYMESSYCRAEAGEFCSCSHPAFDLTVRGVSRVVVAVYGEAPLCELPRGVATAPAVPFCRSDPATGACTRFNKPRRSDPDPYWESVDRVVRHLAAILKEMQRGATAAAEIASGDSTVRSQLPVYLAEATDDLQTERAEVLAVLKRGSQRAGQTVGPERSILQGVSVRGSCRDGLARAAASVHLINATAGRIWGDAEIPLPQLELELALERPDKPRPLVWLPPDVKPESAGNAAYREFLTQLKAGTFEVRTPAVRSPEVFNMPFDRFVTQLESRLFPEPTAVWSEARKSVPGGMLVYISYRAGNRADVQRLIDRIRRRKYAVAILDHGSGNADLQQRHEANLRYCDGLVVYYGREGTGWAESLTLESRMLVRERQRPKKLGVVPETETAEDFGIIDDDVIPIRVRQPDQFEGLDTFLDAIQGDGHV
jgi:hypothetical protein